MKLAFKTAITHFLREANIALDDLVSKLDKEEEKETIDEDKVDELSSLKDDIESAIEAVEEIYIEE